MRGSLMILFSSEPRRGHRKHHCVSGDEKCYPTGRGNQHGTPPGRLENATAGRQLVSLQDISETSGL